MASAVDICNMALQRAGVGRRLASLEETSPEASTCAFWFAMLRDTALASFPWPWATRRQKLARLDTGATPAEPPRSGWGCVYAVPNDCLHALYLWTGQRNPPAELRVPFAIEMASTGEGRVLLTDVPDAELVYTAPVLDASRYPPMFAHALSYLLASELARSLRKDEAVAARLFAYWEVAVQRAAAASAQQQQPDVAPLPDFLRARE